MVWVGVAFVLNLGMALPASAQLEPGAVLRRLDKDGDGKVSREEARGTLVERLFDRFDKNSDGFITAEETQRGAAEPDAGATVAPEVAKQTFEYAVAPAGVDRNDLALDLYLPRAARQLPVMIYIHGGGWKRGDKSSVGSKVEYFTARGFIFASINYRLVPAVDLLTQLQDSADAIGWIKRNIAQHGGNPKALHLIGHSAGAHHVAILATHERFLAKAGVALSDLASVIELDTQALDVPRMMRDGANDVYRQAFGEDAAVWSQVSPLEHIAPGKGIPPFMLVVAGGNRPKQEQATVFQRALRAIDVRCEFVEAPQHNHGSLNQAIGVASDTVTQALQRFLDAVIASQPTTPTRTILDDLESALGSDTGTPKPR
jgi:acetyl esterase/lipase